MKLIFYQYTYIWSLITGKVNEKIFVYFLYIFEDYMFIIYSTTGVTLSEYKIFLRLFGSSCCSIDGNTLF